MDQKALRGLRCFVAFVVSFIAAPLAAQTLSFDVASIRPNTGGGTNATTAILPGGSFEARNATLRALIGRAYGPSWDWPLPPTLVTGGPDWAHNARYDVQARPPQDARGDPNLQRTRGQEMVRSLLADRFKLRVHTEKRRMEVYQLQLARRDGRLGPCLVRRESERQKSPLTEIAACQSGSGLIPIFLDGEMENTARVLSFFLGRPTVNRTGLEGFYFAEVSVRPDQAPNMPVRPGETSSQDGPSWSAAVAEQLGLKLVEARDEVEVIVIDSVERPSEN